MAAPRLAFDCLMLDCSASPYFTGPYEAESLKRLVRGSQALTVITVTYQLCGFGQTV